MPAPSSMVSTALTAACARREPLKDIVRRRSEILAARHEVAIGARPMLPGVGGFAESHFRLNAAAVLTLAFGWAVLPAWAILAIGRSVSGPQKSKGFGSRG